jgi:hypothetical protein
MRLTNQYEGQVISLTFDFRPLIGSTSEVDLIERWDLQKISKVDEIF